MHRTDCRGGRGDEKLDGIWQRGKESTKSMDRMDVNWFVESFREMHSMFQRKEGRKKWGK